jgi:CubicO group peptidase (beta-lactamase class C family)
LLATIVEKVTGGQFEQFATQQVFYSNGMLTSLYYNLGRPVEIFNRAYCYEKKDGDWSQVDGNLLNGLIGEGGVYTSVRDYFQLDRQIRMGRVLDGDAINLIFTPGEVEIDDFSEEFTFLEPGKAGYAAGWFVQGDKAFHGGRWYGVSTMVVHDLSRPLTIAVFRNTDESVDDLINGLYKIADSYVNYIEQEGSYGN